MTFWLDVMLLVSVCALQTVSFTGLVLHEWLGLAMVGMVLAHLLLAWGWIATQSRRLLAMGSVRARINYFLNLGLFAGVTAAIFSGVLISQTAIPALTGTKAAPVMDWHWDTLHNRFSEFVVLLSGFHLAINWNWVLAAVQKVVFPWLEKVREGLSRLVLLSLAAASFAGLTGIYGGAVQRPLPDPIWQAERRHRPSAPQVSKFGEFAAEVVTVALYAAAGRMLLRLRLSGVSPSAGQPITLRLFVEREHG